MHLKASLLHFDTFIILNQNNVCCSHFNNFSLLSSFYFYHSNLITLLPSVFFHHSSFITLLSSIYCHITTINEHSYNLFQSTYIVNAVATDVNSHFEINCILSTYFQIKKDLKWTRRYACNTNTNDKFIFRSLVVCIILLSIKMALGV